MSERGIRERAHAFHQRMEALESRTRSLTLRAYPGAVRTARADTASPGIYTEFVSVLEVVIPSGRWEGTGLATFTVITPGSNVDLQLRMIVSDPVTDERIVSSDIDTPIARHSRALTARMDLSMACFCDIIVDDNAKVSLQTYNAIGAAYTLADLRLKMLPV